MNVKSDLELAIGRVSSVPQCPALHRLYMPPRGVALRQSSRAHDVGSSSEMCEQSFHHPCVARWAQQVDKRFKSCSLRFCACGRALVGYREERGWFWCGSLIPSTALPVSGSVGWRWNETRIGESEYVLILWLNGEGNASNAVKNHVSCLHPEPRWCLRWACDEEGDNCLTVLVRMRP